MGKLIMMLAVLVLLGGCFVSSTTVFVHHCIDAMPNTCISRNTVRWESFTTCWCKTEDGILTYNWQSEEE